ncbi:MAG: helix-turn-helix domain-containing protein [Clostridia bacterium]|nr:helix-turn-helix domain-containing protein [Clostridia bacterium]
MTNAEQLGNRLYELRKKAGLSQEEFAEKLNVSRQAVSKWERGEALPDTENLISIAKLFGVSLDELIDNEVKSEKERKDEPLGDDSQNVNVNIDVDGLNVNVEDGEKTVSINLDLDDLNVKIKKPPEIEFGDEDEIFYSADGKPEIKKHSMLTRILLSLPYPILVTIGFLLWGFLVPNGFSVSWTLFLTIPVYYSIIECFRYKKFAEFCYPVFIVAVYCFIGMQWSLWHPYWIMFITIPIYYCIAEAIDKR